jgi:hypothetical protein
LKVLVVGIGTMGARHVQGCLRAEGVECVYVFDKDDKAIQYMKNIVNDDPICDLDKVQIVSDFKALPRKVDLCIVATSARGRAQLLFSLVKTIHAEFWIFEKLLEQSIDAIDSIEKYMRGQNCWVNTPRRVKKIYNKVPRIDPKEPFMAQVVGKTWGIASNAIHYIDYFEYLTDRQVVSFDTTGLDSNWYNTKRPGYFDVKGELKISFENGGKLILVSNEEELGLKLSIRTNTKQIIIDELQDEYCCADEVAIMESEFQSDLMPIIITDLQNAHCCNLPDLRTSARQHRLIISSLLDKSPTKTFSNAILEAT